MKRAAALCLCACFAMAAAAAPSKPVPPPRYATLPAASPDGRQVVFCTDRDSGATELYLLDVGTGLGRRLTSSPAEELVPAWSPGGERIVYTVSRGDTADLLSVAVNGSGTRTLASVAGKAVRLSNDGHRIAWTSGSWTRNRIRVAGLDGSKARAVTDSSSGFFNLAWSPDDRTLAATHRDSTGALQIWLVTLESGKTRELVRLPQGEGSPQWPAWSPDGKFIAFQAGSYDRQDPTKSDAYVCVVDVGSGAVRRLREHPVPWLDETPSWLGRDHIAFQSTQSGRFEVWLMKSDGSGARQLTR